MGASCCRHATYRVLVGRIPGDWANGSQASELRESSCSRGSLDSSDSSTLGEETCLAGHDGVEVSTVHRHRNGTWESEVLESTSPFHVYLFSRGDSQWVEMSESDFCSYRADVLSRYELSKIGHVHGASSSKRLVQELEAADKTLSRKRAVADAGLAGLSMGPRGGDVVSLGGVYQWNGTMDILREAGAAE